MLLRELTPSPKGGSKPTVNGFKDSVSPGAANLNVLRGEAKFRNVGDSLGLRVRFLELVVERKEIPLAFRKPGEDNCSPEFGRHRSSQDVAISFRAVGCKEGDAFRCRFRGFNWELHRKRRA